MRSLYFNFLLIISFFLSINKSYSENDLPPLDLNKDQNEIVQNAISSCEDVNFDNSGLSKREWNVLMVAFDLKNK